MEEKTLLKERLVYYRKNKIVCHIVTFQNYHYNGLILKQDDTHILIDDRIEGEKLIPISDIRTIGESTKTGRDKYE